MTFPRCLGTLISSRATRSRENIFLRFFYFDKTKMNGTKPLEKKSNKRIFCVSFLFFLFVWKFDQSLSFDTHRVLPYLRMISVELCVRSTDELIAKKNDARPFSLEKAAKSCKILFCKERQSERLTEKHERRPRESTRERERERECVHFEWMACGIVSSYIHTYFRVEMSKYLCLLQKVCLDDAIKNR